MAAHLKMSHKSLRTIMRGRLGLSFYKWCKVHLFSRSVREKWLSISKGLLMWFASFCLYQVLFSNEKFISVVEVSNSQNDRILSQSLFTIPNKFRYVKRVQKPLSDMVWVGISSIDRTPLVFVPIRDENLCFDTPLLCSNPIVKISSEQYLITSHSRFNKMVPPLHCKKHSKVASNSNSELHIQAGMGSFQPRS